MKIVQKHPVAYDDTIEMNDFYLMLVLLMIISDNSASFNFTQKITGKTEYNGRKDIEIMVPLKYLSPFWMPLIYCEINLV